MDRLFFFSLFVTLPILFSGIGVACRQTDEADDELGELAESQNEHLDCLDSVSRAP